MFDPEAMLQLQDRFDPLKVARTIEVYLKICIHRDGAMSVEGPTADPAFCKKMMDEAYAAILRNQRPEHPALIVPGQDVDSRAQESYR